MSTLADMRSRIADDLNRTDLNTQIDKAINRAIQYYASKRFWFNETTGSFSTVASQEAYGTADGIPSDILEIDYVKIIISSSNHDELKPRTFHWIQKMNEGRATGWPTDYTWYQNKIYFYLIPSTVQTITLFYRKSYSDLSLDADTNDFTSYAEDLIESRASWWIYSRILKDRDSANDSKAQELDAYKALQERTDHLISTNQIEATDF